MNTEQPHKLGLGKAAPLSYAAFPSRLCEALKRIRYNRESMNKIFSRKISLIIVALPVFLALVLGVASNVQSEIFKYVDDQGKSHYVDSIEKVPPHYQDQLTSRPQKTTGGTPSQTLQSKQPDDTSTSTDAKIIPYKITSQMWNADIRKSVPTPQTVIDKIHAVLRLWQSVPEANLQFRYAGLSGTSYSSSDELPSDGTLYYVLNGNRSFGNMVAGEGGYSGTIPGNYQKGYVFLNTQAGLYTMKLKTLIHETGHALGISGHSVNIASIMSCGTPSWSGHEFLTFAEQDRVNLAYAWNPEAISTISGTISTNGRKFVFVHSVNIVNGRTFSSMTNHKGEFTIPIASPGEYRVFAKGYESSAFDKPVAQSPGWYVSDRKSTNNPTAGKVFSLTGPSSRVEGLQLAMLEQPVPFNFFWSLTIPTSSSVPVGVFVPSFLRPGHSVRFKLIYNGGNIQRVEPYGRQPDYEVSAFDPNSGMITINAHRDAASGHRLLIAVGDSGPIQAGLVGLHIIRSELPGYVSAKVGEQITGQADFAGLNQNFWK